MNLITKYIMQRKVLTLSNNFNSNKQKLQVLKNGKLRLSTSNSGSDKKYSNGKIGDGNGGGGNGGGFNMDILLCSLCIGTMFILNKYNNSPPKKPL